MQGLPTRPVRAAAVALGLAMLFAPAALAHHWRLETATLPAPFLRDGRVDVVIEPSGVVPLGDGRRVLVTHDKAAPIYVVDVATGAVVGAPLSSPKFSPKIATGPKWEGMTLDSEGNYYLVDSHSGKSDEERAASSAVVRFRLREGASPAIDDASVVRWDIARPLEAALRAQRLDEKRVAEQEIGGLAIREVGGRRLLVIGVSAGRQGPRLRSRHHCRALARCGARAPPHVHVRGRPLRGRRRAAHLARVCPSDERISCPHRDEGRRQRVPRQHHLARRRRRDAPGAPYATFEVAMKAAGLAVLSVEASGHLTTIKLIITYDNDPHVTRIPGRFQTATLVHERS